VAITVVTPPALEPVELWEAKDHLRLDTDDHDDLVAGLIVAARRHVEAFLHRALLTQTRELGLDCFPAGEIRLPYPPLQSVTGIVYVDEAGAEQTLATSGFQVDARSEPGRVLPAYGKSWPSTRAVPNAVRITYVAGYGATPESLPAEVLEAVKVIVHTLYENPTSYATGTIATKLPFTVDALLWPLRVFD
jgi:uncharacterized phiE125 gp8 family phage protein